MKLRAFGPKDFNPEGAPPEIPLGYLAPSVGAFSLFTKTENGTDSRSGQASFVWFHDHDEAHGGHTHPHLVVDWHNQAIRFAGTAFGENYYAYQLVDSMPGDAKSGDDAEIDLILFARNQTDSGVDHRGNGHQKAIDEGYRIYYVAHGHCHLWCWDARTFTGHDDEHDSKDKQAKQAQEQLR